MINCNLKTIKKNKVDQALKVFQGNAKSIKIDENSNTATIRWGSEYRVKTREQAWNMMQSNINRVQKWSQKEFNRMYNDWVTLDGQNNDKIIARVRFPRELERSYVIRLARQGDEEAIDIVKANPAYYGARNVEGNKDPVFYQTSHDNKVALDGLDKVIERVMKNNGINIHTKLTEYTKVYETKTGKKLTAIGFADIANNLISYAQNKADGTTLLEEAVHFITHYLWDTGELDAIKNTLSPLVDPETGQQKRWLETTPQWRQYYDSYKELYLSEGYPDWQKMVDQEIATKIITEKLYQDYKDDHLQNPTNWWDRQVARIRRLWRKLFAKKNPDGTFQLNFPKEVKKELGDLSKDFFKETLILDKTSNPITPGDELIFVNPIAEEESPIARKVDEALKRLINTRNKLMNQIMFRYNKQFKARKDELQKKYSIKDITDLENLVKSLIEKETLTRDEEIILDELYTLDDLFKREAQDQKLVEDLKTLNKRKGIIEENIKLKRYQKAIQDLILGEIYMVPGQIGVSASRGSLFDEAKGLIEEIEDILKEKEDKPNVLAYPPVIKAQHFLNNFKPFIQDLITLINDKEVNKEDALFDELSDDEVEEFKQEVINTRNKIVDLEQAVSDAWSNAVQREITDLGYKNISGERIGNLTDEEIKDLANSPDMDINPMQAYIGSMVDMSPRALQNFIKSYASILNRTNRRVQDQLLPYYRLIADSRKADLHKNPIIAKYLKKYRLSRPEQLVYEMDSKGIPTGYYLGEYNMGKWKRNQDIEANRIYDEIEKEVQKHYDTIVKIPRGNSEEDKKARRRILFEESRTLLTAKERADNVNPIVNLHNKLWNKWYKANTKLIGGQTSKDPNTGIETNTEIENIIKERREQLTDAEFNEWYRQNTWEFTDALGNIHIGYAGEFVTPNTGYLSTDYFELIQVPMFKKILDKQLQLKRDSDDKLPIFMTSSYEFRRQTPQLSNDNWDLFNRTSRLVKAGERTTLGNRFSELWKISKEQITGTFMSKADDDYQMRNISSDVKLPKVYTPPIRYINKLENNESLSLDVNGNLAAYVEMAENYSQISSALPYFEAVKESLARTTMTNSRNNLSNAVLGGQVLGIESLSMKALNSIMEAKLYGKTTHDLSWGKFNVTKTSKALLSYIKKQNLKGNNGAILAGVTQLLKEQTFETLIQRTLPKDSSKFATAEFIKNSVGIIKDFERPIKTNKYTILGQRLNFESNKEMFRDTDKLRSLNMAGKMMNFGVWRMGDYMSRMVAMIAIMDSYRYINNKWYNRESWLLEDSSHTEEQWKSHKDDSFLNKITIVDGKIKYPKEIKDGQWDFVTNRVKLIMRDMSQQKTDLDTSMADLSIWAPFLLMHRGYLTLGIDKKTKRNYLNTLTEKREEGNYNYLFGALFKPGEAAERFSTMFMWNLNHLKPEQREGVMNTRYAIGYFYLSFFLWWLFASDFDDDRDSAFLQFLAYQLTRNLQESATWLGPSDLWKMITRPVSMSRNFGAFDALMPWEEDNIWENKPLENSPYKNRLQKTLIDIAPGPVRGIYETLPLNTAFTNAEKALYYKRKTIEKTGPANTPLLIPTDLFLPEK